MNNNVSSTSPHCDKRLLVRGTMETLSRWTHRTIISRLAAMFFPCENKKHGISPLVINKEEKGEEPKINVNNTHEG